MIELTHIRKTTYQLLVSQCYAMVVTSHKNLYLPILAQILSKFSCDMKCIRTFNHKIITAPHSQCFHLQFNILIHNIFTCNLLFTLYFKNYTYIHTIFKNLSHSICCINVLVKCQSQVEIIILDVVLSKEMLSLSFSIVVKK